MDHGSHLDHFTNQIKFWGIQPSYAFVAEPQTNGVAERFNSRNRSSMADIEELNAPGFVAVQVLPGQATPRRSWPLVAPLHSPQTSLCPIGRGVLP